MTHIYEKYICTKTYRERMKKRKSLHRALNLPFSYIPKNTENIVFDCIIINLKSFLLM